MKFFHKRIEYALKYFPDLSEYPVLDVGCGDAVHLRYFVKGSVGLDARQLSIQNSHYKFIQWNFEEDILDTLRIHGLNKFKYIWSSSVIEHVMSPHLFLINIRRALEDEGLLFLGCPLINKIASFKLIRKSRIYNYFHGFLSQDHVNFFNYKTLRLTCEFAGFKLLSKYSPFFPLRDSPLIGIEPFIMLVLKKKENFQYGHKAYKRLDADGRFQWKQLDVCSTKDIPE